MESVVEMFEGKHTGSGQVKLDGLSKTFRGLDLDDMDVLHKLAELPSYDVFSLRILLRKHHIAVNDDRYLQLSGRKRRARKPYETVYPAACSGGLRGGHRRRAVPILQNRDREQTHGCSRHSVRANRQNERLVERVFQPAGGFAPETGGFHPHGHAARRPDDRLDLLGFALNLLAKPVTVTGLSNRMVTVIDRPRRFVETDGYFGPDRQRRMVPYSGEERRKEN